MVGAIGGDQLGLYFIRAAQRLGLRAAVLDPRPTSRSHQEADLGITAEYHDRAALDLLADKCVGVAVQLEAVPSASLKSLARNRFTSPAPEALAIAQDRLQTKRMLGAIGLATAPFGEVLAAADAMPVGLFPGILKTARNGCRGEGQVHVEAATDLPQAWRSLGCVPCVLESEICWDRELSVILARADHEETETYPVVENVYRGRILEMSFAPAAIPAAATAKAAAAAALIAESLDHVGVLAVEFFLRGEELLVNEFSLRPHETANFTVDACVTSQFEQQIRALTGMPLGAPHMRCAAATVNLRGDDWHAGEAGLRDVAQAFGVGLHLYGNAGPQAGRSLGHFIILDQATEQATRRATELREALDRLIEVRAG